MRGFRFSRAVYVALGSSVELIQATLAVLLGWVVTLKSLNWVAQWLWGIWTQVSAERSKRSVVAALAATVLVPAPWVLIVLTALTLQFMHAWWALWVAVGAGAGVIFFGWAVVEARRRVREGRNENAA